MLEDWHGKIERPAGKLDPVSLPKQHPTLDFRSRGALRQFLVLSALGGISAAGQGLLYSQSDTLVHLLPPHRSQAPLATGATRRLSGIGHGPSPSRSLQLPCTVWSAPTTPLSTPEMSRGYTALATHGHRAQPQAARPDGAIQTIPTRSLYNIATIRNWCIVWGPEDWR